MEAGSSPFSLGEDVVARCPTEGCVCWLGAVTISIIGRGFLGLEGCNLRDRVSLNSLKVGLGGLWQAALTLILTTCSVAVDTHLVWLGVPASSAFGEYLAALQCGQVETLSLSHGAGTGDGVVGWACVIC